ncbi:MAG: hypothetical protein GKR93_17975 [Gammaproteobacteria bacterium]|nr:hypothetical protein [Gammaproteobacteria bacterium]
MEKVFDYRSLRLLVGMIAMLLPIVVTGIAAKELSSISASYYTNARDVFVGMLFIVGTFLLAYNGHTKPQAVLSKIAAMAAFCIALFPTACECCGTDWSAMVHYMSAGVFFSILVYFCFVPFQYEFWSSKIANLSRKRLARSAVYFVCGIVMIFCILIIAFASDTAKEQHNLTFIGEWVALEAFGLAWIVSGKFFTLLADPDEELKFRN